MKEPILIGFVAIQLILIAVVGVLAYNQVKPVDDPTQIREMLMRAIGDIKKPAPVEARTGDVYFPEYKVYLPSTEYSQRTLTYEIYEDKLSVGTDPVTRSEVLYAARTSEDLFNRLPKVQSCERGVQIAEEELTSEDGMPELVLAHEVVLSDSRTLYIHYEDKCSELESLAKDLAKLREY